MKFLFLILLLSFFLRVGFLTISPPALHGDEMGVSYNAFSLFKSGRDEYGQWLPLTFRNDLTPLDVYLTIPYIATLGLNEFSTRVHSVISGILTIFASFILIRLFFNKKIALLTIFLLAILPWHIHTSRIGLGVNTALFLQIAGAVFFLRGVKSSTNWLIYSFLAFGLSTYAYHAPKLTSPLLLLSLIFIYRKRIKKKVSLRKLSLLFMVAIIIPTLVYIFARPIRQSRFGGVNVLLLRNSGQSSSENFILKIPSEVIKNYFLHFHPYVLFFDSQKLKYFQIPKTGMFYVWELPFMLLGAFLIWQNRKAVSSQLVLLWVIIAPLASSLTLGAQFSHFNRVMLFLPILPLLTSIGLYATLQMLKVSTIYYRVFLGVFILIVVSSLAFFLKQYLIILPKDYAWFWGTHLKEAALFAVRYEPIVDRIIMTNSPSSYAQMYIYVLFYGQKDPSWLYNSNSIRNQTIGYSRMGKFEFRPINWIVDKRLKNTLIIGTVNDIPEESAVLKTIFLPNNEQVLRIVRTN